MTKKPDPADKHREYRMNRVQQMLKEDRSLHLASMTDAESKPGVVIMAIAIRGKAVFEVEIPVGKYEPFLLMDLINKYGGEAKRCMTSQWVIPCKHSGHVYTPWRVVSQ